MHVGNARIGAAVLADIGADNILLNAGSETVALNLVTLIPPVMSAQGDVSYFIAIHLDPQIYANRECIYRVAFLLSTKGNVAKHLKKTMLLTYFNNFTLGLVLSRKSEITRNVTRCTCLTEHLEVQSQPRPLESILKRSTSIRKVAD